MVAIATVQDLYRLAPAGALVSRAVLVASVNVANNTFEVEGHGLDANTAVMFATDFGSLPDPLVSSTVYYAKTVDFGGGSSPSLFQVAATEDGAAINLTSSGEHVRLITSNAAMFEAVLEAKTRWFYATLKSELPAEGAGPFPSWAVDAVATMALASIVRRRGLGNLQSLVEDADEVRNDVIRMGANGARLRDSASAGGSNFARGRSPETLNPSGVIP